MNENQKIKIQTKNGEIVEAEVLVIVEIDDIPFCIYTISNEDGTSDILASYVVKNEEGYDDLKEITNPKDLEKVESYIKTMINI